MGNRATEKDSAALFRLGQRGGEERIADRHHGGEREQDADAVTLPDPSPERRRKDRDQHYI